jgi:hypothetical protein
VHAEWVIERQKSRYTSSESYIKATLNFDWSLRPEDILFGLIIDHRRSSNAGENRVHEVVEQRYFTFFTSHGILDAHPQSTHRTH